MEPITSSRATGQKSLQSQNYASNTENKPMLNWLNRPSMCFRIQNVFIFVGLGQNFNTTHNISIYVVISLSLSLYIYIYVCMYTQVYIFLFASLKPSWMKVDRWLAGYARFRR